MKAPSVGFRRPTLWPPTINTESARQIGPTETPIVVQASTLNNRHHGLSAPPAVIDGIASSRETLAPQDVAIPSPDGSSFADRFDAVFNAA